MNNFYKISKSILSAPRSDATEWIALVIIIPLLALLNVSCLDTENIVYSEFMNIGEEGIPEDWEYEFLPFPSDSSLAVDGRFDLILAVRYTEECKAREVVMDIEEFSLKQERPDTIGAALQLFNEFEEPLGKGIYSIYEITDTIRRNFKIEDGYSVSVSSPVAPDKTKGIRAIGVILSKVN